MWLGYSTATAEDIYWTDGSYWEICTQINPCKVSYSSDNHTAISTPTNDIFRSKWGTYPLMQHDKNYTPYNSNNLKYYIKPFTITGNNSICSNALNNYNAVNVPSGYIVTWSLSPSGIATITSNGNSCSLVRNGTSNGQIALTATISLCGVTYQVSKSIKVGMPYSLYGAGGGPYQGAVMETDFDEGPCNTQCYSPGGPNKNWSASAAYNATSDSWQKVWSIPSNYAFWSASNNTISLFFKGQNQYVELRRTITNACGSIQQYYCFTSNTTLCPAPMMMMSSTTVNQTLKVYPNPTLNGSTIALELFLEEEQIDFENATIQLIDKNNKIVLEKTGRKVLKESINLPSSISNGTYYVSVTNSNGIVSSELIINGGQ